MLCRNRLHREVAEASKNRWKEPALSQARVKVLLNDRSVMELRARVYSDLAHYVYPKRKAVKLSSGGSPDKSRRELVAGAAGAGTHGLGNRT